MLCNRRRSYLFQVVRSSVVRLWCRHREGGRALVEVKCSSWARTHTGEDDKNTTRTLSLDYHSPPDDLGVYLIRACGYIMPFCLNLGVGLDGLAPSPHPITSPGSNGFSPLPTPALGGLPLTKDDFQTHRPSIPILQLTAHTIHPFGLLPKNHYCLTQLMTSITSLGLPVLVARKAKRRSWQATRRYARIISRPSAVGLHCPPLQRLLRRPRFARHRLRARST